MIAKLHSVKPRSETMYNKQASLWPAETSPFLCGQYATGYGMFIVGLTMNIPSDCCCGSWNREKSLRSVTNTITSVSASANVSVILIFLVKHKKNVIYIHIYTLPLMVISYSQTHNVHICIQYIINPPRTPILIWVDHNRSTSWDI